MMLALISAHVFFTPGIAQIQIWKQQDLKK